MTAGEDDARAVVPATRPGFRAGSFVDVTGLLDPANYAGREPTTLYRALWHRELHILALERTLEMGVLRCETPEMVWEEFRAHLLAADLIRGVMGAAARRHGPTPRRQSFRGAADDRGVTGGTGPVAVRFGRGAVVVLPRSIATVQAGAVTATW